MKYTVIWHYIANYSSAIPVFAQSPSHAAEQVYDFYKSNPEFREKATLFVFEGDPVFVCIKGQPVAL